MRAAAKQLLALHTFCMNEMVDRKQNRQPVTVAGKRNAEWPKNQQQQRQMLGEKRSKREQNEVLCVCVHNKADTKWKT